MNTSEYRSLVLQIYDTVSDVELWPSILDRITELTGSRGCIIFEWQKRGELRSLEAPLISTSYQRELVDEYIRRFHEYETRDHDMLDRALLSRDGIDLVSEEILYDNEEDYLARPHVQELKKLGIRYRTGALLDKDNPYRARFSLAMTEERGPFVETEVALLKDLLPHLAKALELSRSVSLGLSARETLLTVLDQLTVGICLLDGEGNLIVSNEEFDRQRDKYNAFHIDARGRLSLNEYADRRKFARLLSDALNHGRYGARPRKEAVVFESSDLSGSLCIEIVPLDRSRASGTAPIGGALVISRDTEMQISIDLDLVRNVFELTGAEASIVEQVCEGLTNSEIAQRRERSVETINSQLKTIFNKTRAINRTQLVRLLCNFSLPSAILTR